MHATMRLFETHATVSSLSQSLATQPAGPQALALTVTLAWYVRQSDPERSKHLAQQARALLSMLSPADSAEQSWEARLDLIAAESMCLASNFSQATALAKRALAAFAQQSDALGLADSHYVLASIHSGEGDLPQRDEALAHAVSKARLAADSQRVDVLEANQARYASLRDVRLAQIAWGQRFAGDQSHQHPTTLTHICTYLSAACYNTGHFDEAIKLLDQGYDAACDTGQILTAVVIAVNAANSYMVLNDHDTTLIWLQRGLELARPTGWPAAVGPCLRQMGETLHHIGRSDEAQALLEEAFLVYAPMRHSRNFTSVLHALGDLAFERGDYAKALEWFQQQAERALHLDQADIAIESVISVANTMLALGNAADAEAQGLHALEQAQKQGAADSHMNALRLLARICATRGQSQQALLYLEQALATAKSIEGYSLPGEFLFELAAQYASCDRMQDAYRTAVQASHARESAFSQQASNRATAIQTRIETERARTETEHHRRQAESETKRAEILQQTSDTLELLGTIGQEITSQLDQEHVFEAIQRHVNGLLDASSFCIYLMDPGKRSMTAVFDFEEGVRLPGDQVQLDSATSFSARCVRERNELLITAGSEDLNISHLPGTMVTHSALFAPLIVGERVLGVMTIQSPQRNAYAEKERLIFRTLCAYAAIALDNSIAYTHLRDAKDQLVAQEKLAALGSLVAGVAHELNTPIGNSLLTASALQHKTEVLHNAVANGTLRRSTLQDFLSAAQEGTAMIVRGLQTAADLVQSFKQVAIDQATEQRRAYGLLKTSQDVVATLHRSISQAGHHLEMVIDDSIVLDGYPGPYGQVLTNLINNALLHAFEGRSGGIMRLSAKLLPADRVAIEFVDNGVGMSEDTLRRIFEPFFTTKMGQGGSGLGLSISYNIVTSLFGGELLATSVLGRGSCFTLRIPRVAPQPTAATAQKYHFQPTAPGSL